MPNLAKISTLTPEQAVTFAERIVSGNRAAVALPLATPEQVATAAAAIYCQSNPPHPGIGSDVWGGHPGVPSDAAGLNAVLLALVGFRVPTKLVQAELAARKFLVKGVWQNGGNNIPNCMKDRAKLKHLGGWPVATYGGSEWVACNPEWHNTYFCQNTTATVVNRDTLTIEATPVATPAAAAEPGSMVQAKGLGKAAKSAAKRQTKPQTAKALEASLAATPADNAAGSNAKRKSK